MNRKISVMDVSKKYGLEYRLLHAITKGCSWYGDWGYEFGNGSFALTAESYGAAVETLSNLPLSIFIAQGRKPLTRLEKIISLYKSLSERELVNIRDLFCFLLRLIHEAHKSSPRMIGKINTYNKPCLSSLGMCSWTSADVRRVEEAMFKVLRAVSGSNWVSWRALKGAVFKVAPPELLDHCLKEIGGKQAADGMVVRARCNPSSGALEYRLEHGDASPSGRDSLEMKSPTEDDLMRDLKFLYDFLLHPQTILSDLPLTTRNLAVSASAKLLDCKQFLKDYMLEKRLSSNASAICLSCQVDLVEESDYINVPKPPPELLVLPPNSTISDLKLEASRAFQDVYLSLRRFQAEEVIDYSGVDDSTHIKHLFGSSSSSVHSLRIGGRCLGKNVFGKFRMERGLERWTVDCSCGAKDDDGERMLACDVCGVWQHTRCSGIRDSDVVPARFSCQRCGAKFGGRCKEEAGGSGKSIPARFDVR